MKTEKPQTQSLEFKHYFFGVVRVTTAIGKDIYAERERKRAQLDIEYKKYIERGLTK